MDEEELKELQNKLVYLKESGQHHKAWKLNQKMKKAIAKAKYNETKKPSKFKSIFKKSVDAVKEVASDVIDGAPDVIKKAKEVVSNAAEKVIQKTPVVEEDKSFVGKGLTELDKPKVTSTSITNSLEGNTGLMFEDGTSDEITKNGTVYKRGEEGYDAVAQELLASRAKMDEKRKTIKKRN
jgi:sugar-specific transcriptional regulator TrmB